MILRAVPQANVPPTDESRGSCLFLLFGSLEGTSSPEADETEFELVPTVVHRRDLQATRKFIEQSSSSSGDSGVPSPILLPEGVESKRIKLPRSSNTKSKLELSTIIAPSTVTSPAACIPIGTVASMASRNRRHQQSHQGTPYSQPVRTSSIANHDHLSRVDTAHESSTQPILRNRPISEYLTAAVYDPNERFSLVKHQAGSSEQIGIPSPVLANASGSNKGRQRYEKSSERQPASLEGKVRTGHDRHDASANNNTARLGSVIAMERNIKQGRHEVESVYTSVFAANPFGVDLSKRDNEDLSMRATLFPFNDHANTKANEHDVSPQSSASKSSASGSISSMQSGDDASIITKDFHRALSCIAKDKSLPALPAFGISSAKAMSILGRCGTTQSKRGSNDNKEKIRDKSGPRTAGASKKTIALEFKETHEISNGHSHKQQLRDTLAYLGQQQSQSEKIADQNANKRASKIQSILGVNFSTPASSMQNFPNGNNPNGPLTNSTLYNDLYGQVCGSSAGYNPAADTFIFAADHDRNYGHFTNEPVKGSTYSTPTTPSRRGGRAKAYLPSDYEDQYSPMHESAAVSPLRIVKKDRQHNRMSNDGRNSFTGDGIACTTSGLRSKLSARSKHSNTKAYDTHKGLENPNATIPFENNTPGGIAFQKVADLLNQLGAANAQNQNSSSAQGAQGLSQHAGNRTTSGPSHAHRNANPQDHTNSATLNGYGSGDQFQIAPNTNANFRPTSSYYLDSRSGSPRLSSTAKHTVPQKRSKSPVKKMFSSTVEMIGRIMPAGNNSGNVVASNGVILKRASDLKISVNTADQNRLSADLEYIIQDTANRFLIYQHAHGRLSSHSVEKQSRAWYQKTGHQVAEFLYPIAVQRELVEQNLDTITFYGALAENADIMQSIMQTWKYVAHELSIRSFCLPNAELQHFLHESSRLLGLLGVPEGHMLHFQEWSNCVAKTIRDSYQIPHYLQHPPPNGY